MAKLTVLPAELHIKIASELIPTAILDTPTATCPNRHVCALMKISSYWKGIGTKAIIDELRSSKESLRQARIRHAWIAVNASSDEELEQAIDTILMLELYGHYLMWLRAPLRQNAVEERIRMGRAKLLWRKVKSICRNLRKWRRTANTSR